MLCTLSLLLGQRAEANRALPLDVTDVTGRYAIVRGKRSPLALARSNKPNAVLTRNRLRLMPAHLTGCKAVSITTPTGRLLGMLAQSWTRVEKSFNVRFKTPGFRRRILNELVGSFCFEPLV